jgi:hypothetical protein
MNEKVQQLGGGFVVLEGGKMLANIAITMKKKPMSLQQRQSFVSRALRY